MKLKQKRFDDNYSNYKAYRQQSNQLVKPQLKLRVVPNRLVLRAKQPLNKVHMLLHFYSEKLFLSFFFAHFQRVSKLKRPKSVLMPNWLV
jgi:hypothetical protein